MIKPILVPVEALRHKGRNRTERQWKIYNQSLQNKYVPPAHGPRAPHAVGEFSDKRTFHEQVMDLRDNKYKKNDEEYQELRQMLLSSNMIDDIFQERELKRIFEPETMEKEQKILQDKMTFKYKVNKLRNSLGEGIK